MITQQESGESSSHERGSQGVGREVATSVWSRRRDVSATRDASPQRPAPVLSAVNALRLGGRRRPSLSHSGSPRAASARAFSSQAMKDNEAPDLFEGMAGALGQRLRFVAAHISQGYAQLAVVVAPDRQVENAKEATQLLLSVCGDTMFIWTLERARDSGDTDPLLPQRAAAQSAAVGDDARDTA